MAATPLAIETADDLVHRLLQEHPELIGVDDREIIGLDGEGFIMYFFESGHWAQVLDANHGGLTYRLHQPDEE